jgi:hypothetical protein
MGLAETFWGESKNDHVQSGMHTPEKVAHSKLRCDACKFLPNISHEATETGAHLQLGV